MELSSGEPFWRRWGITGRLAISWSVGMAAVGLLTGGIAAAAQDAARAEARSYGDTDLNTYSLAGHVVAVVALACLAVGIAVLLWRAHRRALAAVVVVAVAAGPMTVVAAPVRASLMAGSSMDSVWWWHVVVAAALTAVLAAWTLAAATARASVRPATDNDGGTTGPSDGAVMAVLTVAGFAACWNYTWHLAESPGVLPALGWALLAAAVVVAVGRSRRMTWLATLVLSAVVIVVMRWAYLRQGGWPGVAGWELNGMESPVVLSARIEAMVVLAPIVGVGWRFARSLSTSHVLRQQPVAPSSSAVS